MELSDRLDAKDWINIQKKLVYWDLKLAQGEGVRYGGDTSCTKAGGQPVFL